MTFSNNCEPPLPEFACRRQRVTYHVIRNSRRPPVRRSHDGQKKSTTISSDLGRDKDGNANVVVVELKQWEGEDTERVSGKDGIVETYVGGGIRETTHPSYQAWAYANFLRDFNIQIQETPINLHPVAYLHNYEPEYRSAIDNEIYAPYTEEAPLYLKGDAVEFRDYLEERIQVGDRGELLREIADSGLRAQSTVLTSHAQRQFYPAPTLRVGRSVSRVHAVAALQERSASSAYAFCLRGVCARNGQDRCGD